MNTFPKSREKRVERRGAEERKKLPVPRPEEDYKKKVIKNHIPNLNERNKKGV